VVASKIAAHIADISKGVKGAVQRDIKMSEYRKSLDWEGMFETSVDPEKARSRFRQNMDINSCTMCGKLCAVKIDQK
jgi:phosphomethylpyrimidine synthase